MGKKRVTPKQIAANRANAKKPRGRRPNTIEKDYIDEAKARGRSVIPEGIDFCIAVLRCEIKREVATDAGTVLADPTIEQRLTAVREIFNRCGLPPLTEVDIGKNAFPLVVVGADWPGLAK